MSNDLPKFVTDLQEDGFSVLSWGGDAENGFVEYTNGENRTAGRWRTIKGERISAVHTETEDAIRDAKFNLWGGAMKRTHREIEDAVQKREAQYRKVWRR